MLKRLDERWPCWCRPCRPCWCRQRKGNGDILLNLHQAPISENGQRWLIWSKDSMAGWLQISRREYNSLVRFSSPLYNVQSLSQRLQFHLQNVYGLSRNVVFFLRIRFSFFIDWSSHEPTYKYYLGDLFFSLQTCERRTKYHGRFSLSMYLRT